VRVIDRFAKGLLSCKPSDDPGPTSPGFRPSPYFWRDVMRSWPPFTEDLEKPDITIWLAKKSPNGDGTWTSPSSCKIHTPYYGSCIQTNCLTNKEETPGLEMSRCQQTSNRFLLGQINQRKLLSDKRPNHLARRLHSNFLNRCYTLNFYK
jgi:hypothetical protein